MLTAMWWASRVTRAGSVTSAMLAAGVVYRYRHAR